MNSIQILALFFFGLLVFSCVVYFLTLFGLPLIAAFLLVYVAGVLLMAGMQRRARECADLQRSVAEPMAQADFPPINTGGQLLKVRQTGLR